MCKQKTAITDMIDISDEYMYCSRDCYIIWERLSNDEFNIMVNNHVIPNPEDHKLILERLRKYHNRRKTKWFFMG